MDYGEIITSSSNARIKYLQSLLGKSDKRRDEGLYIVEGVRMVSDASIDDISCVYISDKLLRESERVESIAHEYKERGIDICVVADRLLLSISQTVTPQGIMASVRCKKYDISYDVDTYLLLEDIRDPGNMGTLIRTAEAAGIDMVIMSKGCVDIYNPKTIRSTMGSIERMPFARCDGLSEWQEVIKRLKKCGVRIYGGSLTNSIDYTEADMSSRCAIVIGNEANGISDTTLSMIDGIHIPMQGEIESLNASVAGSILMYEMNRQRRSSYNKD